MPKCFLTINVPPQFSLVLVYIYACVCIYISRVQSHIFVRLTAVEISLTPGDGLLLWIPSSEIWSNVYTLIESWSSIITDDSTQSVSQRPLLFGGNKYRVQLSPVVPPAGRSWDTSAAADESPEAFAPQPAPGRQWPNWLPGPAILIV